jgi:hypothetical protein
LLEPSPLEFSYVKSSPPKTVSASHFRVAGPVTGLKRMPSAMPAISSVALRPLCSFLPWTRFAAVRSSSTASFSFSWISLSVATRVATVVTLRLPISSS